MDATPESTTASLREEETPGLTEAELAVSQLPLPDPATLDVEEREAFEKILARMKRWFYSIPANRGREYRLTPLFQGLLQSPRLAELVAAQQDFFKTVERRGSFTPREYNLASIGVAAALKEQFGTLRLSTVAIADGVGLGTSPQHMKAILDGRLDELAPEDRQLVEYVLATARCRLTRELFEALVARLGVKGAIEFTNYVTFKVGSAYQLAAMWGIQDLESGSSRSEALLQAFIDGNAAPHPPDRFDNWIEAPGTR